MLLREATTVDVSPEIVLCRVIGYVTADELNRLASDAVDAGFAPFQVPRVRRSDEEMRVQTLPAFPRGRTTVLPMRWTAVATPPASPFVHLDGNLELDHAPGRATRLTIVGSYLSRPSSAGTEAPRIVLVQVARVTLGAFLRSLGLLLTAAPPAAEDRRTVIPRCAH